MTFDERYGWLDRLLHRTAFRARTAQHALADVEELMYRDTLDAVATGSPVFVTALPRSGTTILLRLLWDSGHFASHTYQDMPFVLCPMLWNAYTEQFSGTETVQERAHGDGLTVSETSPEAFEEMIWKHFWPDHYEADRIRPWAPDEQNAEFDAFIEAHMRKIIAVRQEEGAKRSRYLSKNNLNIARLGALPPPLQAGTRLIPFRPPLQQAASMHRQHKRFLELHEEDDFVREYMEAIGHHEFGKGLRPINFDDWLSEAPPPTDLAFWVRYWRAAYQHVLRYADASTHLVSYTQLVNAPETALARIARAVDLPEAALVSQADRLDAPRSHPVEPETVPAPLRQAATKVHDRLRHQAEMSSP